MASTIPYLGFLTVKPDRERRWMVGDEAGALTG